MAYNRKQAEAQHGPALVVMALILFTATAEAQILSPLLGGLLPSLRPILSPVVGPIVGPILSPIGGILPPIGGILPPIGGILPPILGGILPPIGSLLNLTGLNVAGKLCCTPNGNCLLGSSGIPGVVVGLNCTNLVGVSIQIGQGTTNVNGIFNISVPNLVQTLGNVITLNPLIPCTVSIPLPLNQTLCPILNTAQGLLNGIPSILNGVVQGLLGLVGNLGVPGLSLSVNAGV